MAADIHQDRSVIIQGFFILVGLVLLGQLLNLQVFNKTFRSKADVAGSSRLLDYPSRGLIFDRNGQLMVVNQPMYDLMFVYNQFEPNAATFDTLKFCEVLGITRDYFNSTLAINWRDIRHSKSKPEPFLTRINSLQYARIQELLYQFPGFYIEERNVRAYPHENAAHLLGYIGEISPDMLEDSTEFYVAGDYLGTSGLERYYEYYLRGIKGVRRVEKDIQGRIIGKVADGALDVSPVSGYHLQSTIDLDLQKYGEELMQNKVGSIVAIEPATGEILAMVSSPNYTPTSLAIGPGRGQRYMDLLNDPLQPLLNRAVQGEYPPGSIFKSIVALVGMQVGTLTPDRGVSCGGAYYFKGKRLTGCHGHAYCGTVATAIQHSCNSYFVTVFREIIDRHKNENTPRRGLDEFNEYLYRFGLGRRLGVDFPSERTGNVPTSGYFDKAYSKEQGWRSIWVRSLGIGQGELSVTNLQIANLAAAIANRGYYITPHLVRGLQDQAGDVIPPPVPLKRMRTGIEARHFTPVVDGMELVVQAGTARSAYIPDIAICGKTGTAENSQRGGKDHSVFFAFAPKHNPKIAIAVYVENSGFGGTYAAPITSLMIEKYINGEIAESRKWMEERMKSANLLPNSPLVVNRGVRAAAPVPAQLAVEATTEDEEIIQ